MNDHLFHKFIQKGGCQLGKLRVPLYQLQKPVGSHAVGVVAVYLGLQPFKLRIEVFLLGVIARQQFGKVVFGDFIGGVAFVQLFDQASSRTR